MNDFQKLFEIMTAASRSERQKYHLTLGDLIDELGTTEASVPVRFDNGQEPGKFGSYRGYYEDLHLDGSGSNVTAGDLLKKAKKALGETFTGYKGGDFVMTEKTPLWFAVYGNTGMAIVGTTVKDGAMILETRDVD